VITQSLDAGHTFDIVFTDLPSLAWLRPAWIEHDLNGRLLYRLQPPHLADVLVDLELASQRYITSRHQKLNIARAIYSLILADETSLPNDIAAWDRYSITLPPINNILTVNSSAPVAQPAATPMPILGTIGNPLARMMSPPNINVPGEQSQPIVFGGLMDTTPAGMTMLVSFETLLSRQHNTGFIMISDEVVPDAADWLVSSTQKQKVYVMQKKIDSFILVCAVAAATSFSPVRRSSNNPASPSPSHACGRNFPFAPVRFFKNMPSSVPVPLYSFTPHFAVLNEQHDILQAARLTATRPHSLFSQCSCSLRHSRAIIHAGST
jgi:hypothetical protein